MIEQTSSIVISIGARSGAPYAFVRIPHLSLLAWISLPADQTIVWGKSRSCDASHTKDGAADMPSPLVASHHLGQLKNSMLALS